ncbi:hypothetical protein LCGC14_0961360 [marine sediment metagenome]|uniref:Uncharacterized protein n=1 Tax=marine sediment metagenome TaxID=412755 RepID=A0A0F9P0J0_9ZZZZ
MIINFMGTERETKKIKTPNGHEVEIYTYLNGREQRAIDNILVEAFKIKVELTDSETEIRNKITPELMAKQEDKTIELMVVSVNGKKENLVDTILDMKSQDYNVAIEAINKVISVKKG